MTPSISHAAALSTLEQERLYSVLPSVEQVSEPSGEFGVRTLHQDGEIVGYAFQTNDVLTIPAYSGRPINFQVIMDPQANILDAYVLHHDEPILLIGIPEHKLHNFVSKYQGVNANQRVVIGHSKDDSAITIDAVSGATVTVMVANETVMRATHKVAIDLGLISADVATAAPQSTINTEVDQVKDWETLINDGSVAHLSLTRGQVDDAFVGTEGEGVDNARPEQRDEQFIDLYFSDLTVPTIGRSILGDKQYERLQDELVAGEHAILVAGNGSYSFKGSGYVRGGIFDRVQLRQYGDIISFRDLDFTRLNDVYAEGMPRFSEMAIFIVRSSYELDPGQDWSLELLVRKQIGPVSSVFTIFEGQYQTPEAYLNRPEAVASEPLYDERPMWVTIWEQKTFQITVLVIALALLVIILFIQDYLVRRPRLIHFIRNSYLTFTVIFIGWYALGQLSIVNVLTFVHSLFDDFNWGIFLNDPIIFILWTFTAAATLLWGRGIFCGWLCPFGALQELINEIARKLKIKQYTVPFGIHERLWAIKYIVLFVLFGLSLQSLATAEKFAEVEPFKTTFTLGFDRQWWFVLYAVILLVINIFTRKVYCRYICPLGAALAIPTRVRLFDWLKRRKDCGSPCQLCAKECEVQAIHPDGTINASECHHCLDCQVTYYNDNRCPPLVATKKRKQRKQKEIDNALVIETVQLEDKPL
ncbi:transcriptional regulator NosR [Oceanisphaera avium]|nr:NosR/NirI family protein [Oceanisphaera avium]